MQLTEKQKSEGWRIVKFGEIAKSVSKRVDPSETELEVYVGLEHLDPDNLRITRRGVPSDVKGQKLLVKPGQIIFGKRRAYQRKVAVADFEGICSAHAMVLEAIPEAVVPEYLPFFMQSDMFMERAVAISEGSLSPTIKWKKLANQEFPLPPRPRQEEMLEILNSFMRCIALNKSAEETLKRLRRVLVQKLFPNSGKNAPDLRFPGFNSHWEISHLKDQAKCWDGTHQTPNYIDQGVPFFSVEHITSDNFENTKFISEEVFEKESKRVCIEKGDLLMTRIGDIGTVKYIDWDVHASFYVSLALIRTGKNLNSAYLAQYIRATNFQRELYKRTIHVAFPKKINLGEIGHCIIHYPSLAEQKKISDFLMDIDIKIKRREKNENTIQKIKSKWINELLQAQ